MRYHKPSKRVFALITDPAIPRRKDGHVRLCPSCQRNVFWANGFLDLLARDLEREARIGRTLQLVRQREAAKDAMMDILLADTPRKG